MAYNEGIKADNGGVEQEIADESDVEEQLDRGTNAEARGMDDDESGYIVEMDDLDV